MRHLGTRKAQTGKNNCREKERIMQHKCQYFLVENGIRVCSVCGKPAKSKDRIEDKVDSDHEDKTIYPSESKRLRGRPKRKK